MSENNLSDIVYNIIGGCMEVHKTLGPGYPTEYYKKALEVEFDSKKLKYEHQKQVEITYKEVQVGTLEIDFLIEDEVVVMIICKDQFLDTEIQQVLRCLQLIEKPMGLLVNFGGTKIQYKRIMPSHRKVSNKTIKRYPMEHGGGKTRENNPIM
ncbi:MAG: GxxExxY protein [bacterium]